MHQTYLFPYIFPVSPATMVQVYSLRDYGIRFYRWENPGESNGFRTIQPGWGTDRDRDESSRIYRNKHIAISIDEQNETSTVRKHSRKFPTYFLTFDFTYPKNNEITRRPYTL